MAFEVRVPWLSTKVTDGHPPGSSVVTNRITVPRGVNWDHTQASPFFPPTGWPGGDEGSPEPDPSIEV
ncbi:hypothetical protein [Actinopolymorpha pittospori]|uniref:hypothetical protein n=1 Tax=Actinopolymorpha pittospori TaxID=648752 RepID=UPI00178B76ED|nr:hypothetical protein [Actinopolymorpha pittospori]